MNRYSYCLNNPLSLVDLSGYSWFSKNWKSLLSAVVGIVVTVASAGIASGIGGVIIAGALGGAAAGLSYALLNGANIWQIAKSTFIGGFWGGVSGFLASASGGGGFIERLFKHSFSQAWLEGIKGGNIKHGFMAGLASAAGGTALSKYGGNLGKVGQITANAVVSGTVSELGGGKFANGAITGAFSMMFNDLMHKNKFNDAELKKMYDAYPKRGEVSADELFENIGGPLKDWYDKHPEQLANTCAIRLSVALNESGNTIPAGAGTFKGKDNKNYYISVSSMTKYLTKVYETPTTLPANQVVKNAIIWQSSCGWSDATGHLDIVYRGQAGSHYYDECGVVKYWH